MLSAVHAAEERLIAPRYNNNNNNNKTLKIRLRSAENG